MLPLVGDLTNYREERCPADLRNQDHRNERLLKPQHAIQDRGFPSFSPGHPILHSSAGRPVFEFIMLETLSPHFFSNIAR